MIDYAPAISARNPADNRPMAAAGHWPSWVSPALVSGKVTGLSELRTAGNWVFWLENRAEDGGRGVVTARAPDGTIRDLTPPGTDVGTRVHEYGGGAWDVRLQETRGEQVPVVVFSDRKAGGVWYADGGGLTCWVPSRVGREERYADFCFEPDGTGAFCVGETHGEAVPVASLLHVGPNGQRKILLQDADFYAAPRPSPDGRFLVWFSWQHPQMPWTETTLSVALLDRQERTLGSAQALAADSGFSTIEPRWADARTFFATSDVSGCWTPVRYRLEDGRWIATSLPPAGAEVGLPHWVFAQRTLAPLSSGEVLALGIRQGLNHVLCHDGAAWTEVSAGTPVNVPERLADGRFAWIDAPADASPAIAIGTLNASFTRLRESVTLPSDITPADISTPQALTFPTMDGSDAHALFYPPASSTSTLAAHEKPPLVVMAHGGPTGRANPAFAFKVQWWTSRGFAVLDVNYRGSTGFGRAYRAALDGGWGVADVEDCLAATRFVIAQGLVDPARCVIRGSSAGGLTVLSALAHSDVFAAGTSLYGVTDLRALLTETHKFEARYLDRLIGPYPEQEARYIARSPITHAARITGPVLFLHGGADKVVPLSQAQAMAARLAHAALHVYLTEGHGFRTSSVIEDALTRELEFYRTVLR